MKNEGIIAYRGQITLDKAIWDNITGMTAVFDLEQRPHELNAANPYKKYTKMRKGRVGTRFSVVIMSEDAVKEDRLPEYEDEVMLKGWNDGTNGWRVTFWINSDADGNHPFMNCDKGSEFSLVAVELDDDNEAIDQVKRDRVESATKARKSPQKLSNFAALLCRTPEFWDYLDQVYGGFDIQRKSGLTNEEAAKHILCLVLGIESRAELDHSEELAAKFHRVIRRPYVESG